MMPSSSFPATKDANQAYAMKAAEFRGIPNTPEGMAMLRQATNGPFGSLALIEIDKRTRAELMEAVQKQAANQQDQTMLQQALQRESQARMMNRMADDERMGLNNLVAQAEQGALEFGAPVGQASIGESEGAMPMGAGGGVVAFRDGGDVPGYAAGALIGGITRAAPYVGRAVGRGISALRNRMVTPGQAALIATPFGFIGGDETPVDRDTVLKDTDYPDETKRGSAEFAAKGKKVPERIGSAGLDISGDKEQEAPSSAPAARTGIASLQQPEYEGDVRKILEREDALMKEMGLGEYGAKARESMAERRRKAEEMYGRSLGAEPLLAAAEAAGGGGKRMSGLQALASAVGAAGKSAAGIRREERSALDKITEGEERLALAEDLYKRGRVSDANKEAKAAQQQIFNNQLKLEELRLQERGMQIREQYNAILGKQSAAKSAGLPAGLQTEFQRQFAKLEEDRRVGAIDDAAYKAGVADIQRRIQEAYMINALSGLQIGTR